MTADIPAALSPRADSTAVYTVTDDRGTVSWTRAAPLRGRRAAPPPADTAAVAGGWLFGPRVLVDRVRRVLDTAADGEHEVRYGAWTHMPDDRDCAEAVLVAMLLALPQGTVAPAVWGRLDVETVPDGAIR